MCMSHQFQRVIHLGEERSVFQIPMPCIKFEVIYEDNLRFKWVRECVL